MTLTELRYIVAVAQERHFGRAAARCFVSQPTLSVGVRKLEEELGVVLFERRRGGAVPTPAGARVVAQAQRVLEAVEALRRLADETRDPLDGPLRLGAIYTIGPYLFPPLIPLLHERAPRMPLVVEEGFTDDLLESLQQGALDAVLLATPVHEPGIEARALYREPFVVLVPASHPWRDREAIAAEDLAAEELLLLGRGHCFREQVIEACPACAAAVEAGRLQHAVAGSSLETIRYMVASGLGITVLPCSAAGADRYSQRLVEIRRFREPVPRRTVSIAWRRGFPRPAAIDAVAAAVRACGLSCVDYL